MRMAGSLADMALVGPCSGFAPGLLCELSLHSQNFDEMPCVVDAVKAIWTSLQCYYL